jgi:hypothetical protein
MLKGANIPKQQLFVIFKKCSCQALVLGLEQPAFLKIVALEEFEIPVIDD